MNNKRNIGLARSCALSFLTIGCLAAIGAHMCFVYMSGQNANLARQVEAEIYHLRSEIVQLSVADAGTFDTRGAVVSHLVVVEPMTVSVSR